MNMNGMQPVSEKKALHPEDRQTSSQSHLPQPEEHKAAIVETPNHNQMVVKDSLNSFVSTGDFPTAGPKQEPRKQRFTAAPESEIKNLIPSDAVTQKLLVEVLAEMIRFEYNLGPYQVNK